ncbi:hypothetical protein [Cellulomonas sp. 73-92]|uniref:hypothetical protein n=1 Tax=Cellulomonas sp. 73-92 TaxID=1895740 RepID=UPI000B315677|nr:hypothetical protein [Cellulomonas sp. 73-92]
MSAVVAPRATADFGAWSHARVGFAGVVGAEWGKLWALRSTWGICVAAVVAQTVVGGLAPMTTTAIENDVPVAAFDAARFPVIGLSIVQLVVLVLAVLTVTSEYSTGLARTTYAVVPARRPVLWAKVVVVTATTTLVSVVGGAAALGAGLAVSGDLYGFGLDGTQTLRLLVSGPLYLAAVAALAVGVATMVRSTAGSLGLLFGELLVVETLLTSLSIPALQRIGAFLPQTAGLQLTRADAEIAAAREYSTVVLTPWAGFAILVGWVVLCLVAASMTLSRRDV